jgi:hypothetical protein
LNASFSLATSSYFDRVSVGVYFHQTDARRALLWSEKMTYFLTKKVMCSASAFYQHWIKKNQLIINYQNRKVELVAEKMR